MNLERQELRTGLLVVLSLAVFVAVLIYLGAPGVFVRQKKFRIYVADAAGLQPGAKDRPGPSALLSGAGEGSADPEDRGADRGAGGGQGADLSAGESVHDPAETARRDGHRLHPRRGGKRPRPRRTPLSRRPHGRT